MKTFVVYGLESKIIRQIVVSDEIDVLSAPDKCEVLEIPFEFYSISNAQEVRQHIISQIGEPLHDGRCVEIDSADAVVAVYNADPLIDKPIFHQDNKIETHVSAKIGDVKVGKEFVSTIPIEIPDRNTLINDIIAFSSKSSEAISLAQAEILADTIIAEKIKLEQERQVLLSKKP